MRTLTQALEEQASHAGDRPFLQWTDHEPLGYAQVYDEVRRYAGGLAGLGVDAGDTVLMMLPNSLDLVRIWFACNAIGALEVPVNTFLRGAFLQHVLTDAQARVLVIDTDHLPYLAEITLPPELDTLVVVGGTGPMPAGLRMVPITDLAAATPVDTLRPAAPGDLSAIYYTSGTTGAAKGIMFTYGQGCVTAANYLEATGATGDDVFFCCMPLFHSNAQILQVLAPLLVGARVSIWPEFSASRWLDQVRSVGATVTNTLGVMSEFVHRQPARSDDADNPLRIVQTIPAPAAIVGDFEQRFGVTCIDGYGLTDVGMVAFRRHDEPLVAGSSGTPMATFELMIADPDTDVALPAGEIGEILLRPCVADGFMRGYWNRPEATIKAWRNLWFHTGDAGFLDSAGRLHFCDRLGDSIRVRGENISSAEIEAVAARHPAVVQCAAVAVPSDVGDYDVLLAVVVAPGHDLHPADLVRFCEGRMPYFAVPRYVELLEELPMTATQKVRKVVLRDRGVQAGTWDRVAAGLVVTR
ncbi:AMP-binding protein [Mycolicibacterium tokaiense]|uniref:AMP-dependent synthetase and ligase n=1 Tax=Mycolicibacterium tokaiense TaxID=39695 RepID=A0A378TQK6_9MYCO|nr:AMP-binding protein [Mycolicibacterium tokaiense]BBY89460.1 ATP-dependent acyl-CoA ligase [Mycolicibacterium tokaiense]STZ62153.1 AMP-dependent synthetase and ligase [Mycolicibacterium tokaiense]